MGKTRLDLTDESRSPILNILTLAWPLFLEQILTTLVSYADTAMVGALGVQATAAVSISNSFVFLINGAVMAMGVGLTACVAQSFGAKDYELTKSYIRQGILLLLVMGLPLALLTLLLSRQIPMWMGASPDILDEAAAYVRITSTFRIFTMSIMVFGSVLRGRGDTKTPLAINATVNVINVVGNYLLVNSTHTVTLGSWSILVPCAGLGVRGAAISTAASWVFGGTVMAVLLFVKKDPTRISLHDSFKPNPALIRRIIKISIPAMLERVCMSLSGILVSKSIASLGTTVVAANTVYITAESISFMPGFAFSTAATTLVGQSLGAKKKDLALRYNRLTNILGIVTLSCLGAMLFFCAGPLVSLFTPDPEATAIAKECLQIVAFIQPIQVVAWILSGSLRGAGQTKVPFYITAVCNWIFRAGGAVIAIRVLGFGLQQAVLCFCTDSLVRCIVTLIYFKRGTWLKKLEQENAAVAS